MDTNTEKLKLWRHERIIEACNEGSVIIDKLTFILYLFPRLSALFVKILFNNRHKTLINLRYFTFITSKQL